MRNYKKVIILISLFLSFITIFSFTSRAWYMPMASVRVNYQDSEGNPISYYDSETDEYKTYKFIYGKIDTEYNIESPIIDGYTPDIDIVKGIFETDITTTVTYYLNKKDCNLKINYIDEFNNIIKTDDYIYKYGDDYYITLKNINGYKLPYEILSGTINEDKIININLISNEYVLTIHYIDECGNKLANDDYFTLLYNQEYNINAKEIKGYNPNTSNIKGIITNDTEINIIYSNKLCKLTIHYVNICGHSIRPDSVYYLKSYCYYNLFIKPICSYTCDSYRIISISEDTDLYIVYVPLYIRYERCFGYCRFY